MTKNNLNVNYQNVYHLFNKLNDIKIHIYKATQTIHMLGISETRLNDTIDDRLISMQNYTLLRRDKRRDKHTGLVVYIHDSIYKFITRRADLETDEIECIWIEFKQNKSASLLVCFMYRNPAETIDWIDKYENMIDNAQQKGLEIIIQGDFNIDLLNQIPKSLVPVLSKPLEKHIHTHMYHYLSSNDLLHQYQSGFRPLHSCHTALVRLCDTWLTAINNTELIGTVFLDFKKAFDLVNHRTLLLKLNEYFPKSTSNELLNSYLADRHQYVFLNNKTSALKKIKSGVPQGSVLGPLLFLIYINDLPLHLYLHPLHPNTKTTNELYADDASIYSINKDINIINNSLQLSLNLAVEWSHQNSMVIHPDKTKSMVITSRQKHQLTKPKLDLFIGDISVEQVKSHKMLGICLDSELNWQTQIHNLTKRLSKNVFLLTKLKKYVNTKHLKLFFDAHILSHLNYSSTVWDGCCKDSFNKINRIHRRAAKIISPIQHISTEMKMKNLEILPLSEHLKYNKAILVHKIYHSKTPLYLKHLLRKAPERYNSLNLIPPLPRIDLFKSSLSFSGSLIWNNLSISLKENVSLNSFKSILFDVLLNKNP